MCVPGKEVHVEKHPCWESRLGGPRLNALPTLQLTRGWQRKMLSFSAIIVCYEALAEPPSHLSLTQTKQLVSLSPFYRTRNRGPERGSSLWLMSHRFSAARSSPGRPGLNSSISTGALTCRHLSNPPPDYPESLTILCKNSRDSGAFGI